MKRKRQTEKGIMKRVLAAVVCLVLVLSLIAPIAASASETKEILDPERLGSITMTFTYFDEKTGDTYPVSGGNSVGLYKVASVVTDSGFKYVTDERFASVGEIPSTDAELDSANLELAAQMTKIAANYEYDKAPKKMDSEGKVSFDGLEVGLYLVLQYEQGTGDNKYVLTPFLISLPYRNPDGSLNYDVNADSKPLKIEKVEEKKPPKKPDKPSDLPQTGQLWWPVAVLGAAGVLFVVAGLVRKSRS